MPGQGQRPACQAAAVPLKDISLAQPAHGRVLAGQELAQHLHRNAVGQQRANNGARAGAHVNVKVVGCAPAWRQPRFERLDRA